MVAELKVFLTITLYLHMKKQLNVRRYWLKQPTIFNCSIICSNLMSERRYMALNRCFHLINPASYILNREFLGYKKMKQVQWMVDKVGKI